MGDENPICTLGDYSKPSHEGYRNTIELPVGNNVERTRLRLFQFSLRDQASNWLERLPPGSITTWEDLTNCFLAKFFPLGRTAKLRNDILIFMASQDARLSKFEADFKQQQSEMTNKIDIVLKAITDRIEGALPSDTVKNPKLKSLELGKNGSAFVQGEVLAKIEDPKLFTLPCRLGESKPFDTLDNLGSCVNIIPLYLFKKLNNGLLEETDHIFGFADETKSYTVRIVKDVEVHKGKLKLLNDFYVIDMKKDPETPLLVGRGFLATANAVIDCRIAKIAVGEGITRSVFRVKGVNLGEEEAPY
ncbi:MAK10-like protein [Tanacetum coccineum]